MRWYVAADASPSDTPRPHLDEDARQLRAIADALPALIAYVDADGLREVPPVDANEGLLEQVFLHLLVNAADAIREDNTGRSEIRITTRTHPSGQIRVQVADTGCGIAPEHVGRIFDPFFTTRPVGKGVGLGLWVSSQILEQIGGHVAVESELGRGTIFTVTLPAVSVPP